MMDRREFLASIPGAITETCRRVMPEMRRLEWLKRMCGATGRVSAQDRRVVALDDSRCQACGEAACHCIEF